MKQLSFLSLLLLVGCASFSLTTPAERLCQDQTNPQYCYHRVKYADRQDFQTPYEAVQYGLAYLLQEYPDLEAAGIVMVNREGKYYFQLAGVGTSDRVNLDVHPRALAWFHTHVKGTRHCSQRDQYATKYLNDRLGREVKAYVQHKSGDIHKCSPASPSLRGLQIP